MISGFLFRRCLRLQLATVTACVDNDATDIARTLLTVLQPSHAVLVEPGSPFQFVLSLTRSADHLVGADLEQDSAPPSLLHVQQRLFAARQRLLVPLTDDRSAVALTDMPPLPSPAALDAFARRIEVRAVDVDGVPHIRADDVVQLHRWASSSYTPDGSVVRLLPSIPFPVLLPYASRHVDRALLPMCIAAAERLQLTSITPRRILDLSGGVGILGMAIAAAAQERARAGGEEGRWREAATGKASERDLLALEGGGGESDAEAWGGDVQVEVDVVLRDAATAHEIVGLGVGDVAAAAARAVGVRVRYIAESRGGGDGGQGTGHLHKGIDGRGGADGADEIGAEGGRGGGGDAGGGVSDGLLSDAKYDYVVAGTPLLDPASMTLLYEPHDTLCVGEPVAAKAGRVFLSGPNVAEAHDVKCWPAGWVPGSAAVGVLADEQRGVVRGVRAVRVDEGSGEPDAVADGAFPEGEGVRAEGGDDEGGEGGGGAHVIIRDGAGGGSVEALRALARSAANCLSEDGEVLLLQTVTRATGVEGGDGTGEGGSGRRAGDESGDTEPVHFADTALHSALRSLSRSAVSSPTSSSASGVFQTCSPSSASSSSSSHPPTLPALELTSTVVRGHAARHTSVSGWHVRPFARSHLRGYDSAPSPAQLRHHVSNGVPGVQVMFTPRGLLWRRTSLKDVKQRYQEELARHPHTPVLVARHRPRRGPAIEFGTALWRRVVYPAMCSSALVMVSARLAQPSTSITTARSTSSTTSTSSLSDLTASPSSTFSAQVAAAASRRRAVPAITAASARRLLATPRTSTSTTSSSSSLSQELQVGGARGASPSSSDSVFEGLTTHTSSVGGGDGGLPEPAALPAPSLRPAAVCPRCGAGFFSVADRDAHLVAFHASSLPGPAEDAATARSYHRSSTATPMQADAAAHLCVGHQFGYCKHAKGTEQAKPRKALPFGEDLEPVRCERAHDKSRCALCGKRGHLAPQCDRAGGYVALYEALQIREKRSAFALRRELVTSRWMHLMSQGWSHYASRTAGRRSGGRPLPERYGSGMREGMHTPIRGSGLNHATGKVHWMKNFGALDDIYSPAPVGTRYRTQDPISEIA